MNDNAKIISALLAGFAAGAVAAILFAPQKGSDLRQKISDTMSEWADNIAHMAESGEESVTDIKERVEEKSHSKGDSESENKTSNSSQKRHA